jgi:acyl carrier protein
MFLKSEGAGIPAQLVKDGFLEPSVLDALALKWHRVLNSEKHSIYRQLFVACGEKIEGAKEDPLRKVRVGVNENGNSRADTDGGRPTMTEDISQDVIRQFVLDLTAQKTNLGHADVNEHTKFNDLGLDSLMVVEMINTIESKWGVILSLMDFFDGQTLSDVASKIEKLLYDEKGEKPSPNVIGNVGILSENDWEEGVI